MDEQVIDDLYARAQSKGYKKERLDFIQLIQSDEDVFNDMYQYVQSKGYKKDSENFSFLIGKTEAPAVKKKEETVTDFVSEPGSLVSPEPEVPVAETVVEEEFVQPVVADATRVEEPVLPTQQIEQPDLEDLVVYEDPGAEIVTEAEGEKNTWVEDFAGKNFVTDFFGDIYRAGAAGQAQGASVDESLELMTKGKDVTDEDIQDFLAAQERMASQGESEEMKEFNKIYEANGKGFLGFLMGTANNPTILPQLFVSSVTAMATPATIAAGAAGAGAGAAIGATGFSAGPLGVFTTLGGTLAGAMGAMGTTLETGLAFSEFLQEELEKKGLEMTTEGIRKVLEDPEAIKSMRYRAAGRGITIGAFNAVTAGVGSQVVKSVAKATGRKAVAGLAGAGVEVVSESTGEVAGRLVAGQEMDVAEIGFEGFAGGVPQVIGLGRGLYKSPTYKINNETVSGPVVADFIKNAPVKDLVGATLEIKNDPVLKDIAVERRENARMDAIIKAELAKAGITDEGAVTALTKLEKERRGLEGNGTRAAQQRLAEVNKEIDGLMDGAKIAYTETVDASGDKVTTEVIVTKEYAREELIKDGIESPTEQQVEAKQAELFEDAMEAVQKPQEDAIQEQGPESVDAPESTTDSEAVGEGVPDIGEPTTEVEAQDDVTDEAPATTEEVAVDEGAEVELGVTTTDKKGRTFRFFKTTTEKDGLKTTRFTWNRSDKPTEQRSKSRVTPVEEALGGLYDFEIPEGAVTVAVTEVRESESGAAASVIFEQDGQRFEGDVVLTPKKAAPKKKAAPVEAAPVEEAAPALTERDKRRKSLVAAGYTYQVVEDIVTGAIFSSNSGSAGVRKLTNAFKKIKSDSNVPMSYDFNYSGGGTVGSAMSDASEFISREVYQVLLDGEITLEEFKAFANKFNQPLPEAAPVKKAAPKKAAPKKTVSEPTQGVADEDVELYDAEVVEQPNLEDIKEERRALLLGNITAKKEFNANQRKLKKEVKDAETEQDRFIAEQRLKNLRKKESNRKKESKKSENDIYARMGAMEEAISQEEQVDIDEFFSDKKIEGVDKIGDNLVVNRKQLSEDKAEMAQDERKIRRIKQIAKKAAVSLKKQFPDVKIVLHETEGQYKRFAGKRARGTYLGNDKTIHINLSIADLETMGHEVFHAILLETVKNDPNAVIVSRKMLDSIKKVVDPNSKLAERIDKFVAKYADTPIVQDEEYLAELMGILSAEYTTLDKPAQNAIKEFLRKLAKLIGIDKKFGLDEYFGPEFLKTDAEVIDLLNTVSRKVSQGAFIEASDVAVIDKIRKKSTPEELKKARQDVEKALDEQEKRKREKAESGTGNRRKETAPSSTDFVKPVASRQQKADGQVFTFGQDTYDIDKADNIIKNNKVDIIDVSASDVPSLSFFFVTKTEEGIKNADISQPVIFATTPNGLLLIDGHHRAERAARDGKPLKGYVLSEEQTSSIMPSETAVTEKAIDNAVASRQQIVGERASLEDDVRDGLDMAMLTYTEQGDSKKVRREVKAAWGWEKGADGKWRYEIETGKLKKVPNGTYKLSDVYDAPELYKAYPEAKDISLTINVRDAGAENSWLIKENAVEINVKNYGRVRPDLIHELQHYIQLKEGFAIGGNTGTAIDLINSLPPDKLKEINFLEGKESAMSMLSDIAEESELTYVDDLKSIDTIEDFLSRNTKDANLLNSLYGDDAASYVLEVLNEDLIDLEDGDLMGGIYQVLKPIQEQTENKDGRSMWSPFAVYERLIGEVEARNAASRDGGGRSLIEDSEDTPREDQLAVFGEQEKVLRKIEAKEEMTEQELDALDLAKLPAQEGSNKGAGLFYGPRATIANYESAKTMFADGAPAEDIEMLTGWNVVEKQNGDVVYVLSRNEVESKDTIDKAIASRKDQGVAPRQQVQEKLIQRSQAASNFTDEELTAFAKEGILFHGSDMQKEFFDSKFIKEFNYGYGFYFTGVPALARKYGDKLSFVDTKEFKLLDGDEDITQEDAQDMLDNLPGYGLDNEFVEEFLQDYIDDEGFENDPQSWSMFITEYISDYESKAEIFSEYLESELGFDGMTTVENAGKGAVPTVAVVWNFDLLNDNVLQDPTKGKVIEEEAPKEVTRKEEATKDVLDFVSLVSKGTSEDVIYLNKRQQVEGINPKDVRMRSRSGNRVGKGLSVKKVNNEAVVEEIPDLTLDYVRENAPASYLKNANLIAQYPLVRGVKNFDDVSSLEQADEVYEVYARQVADNLNWIMESYPEEYREISTLWYDGANKIANELAAEYGVSPEQVAGIIASLSPQNDWYQNVRAAELLLLAFRENPVMSQVND